MNFRKQLLAEASRTNIDFIVATINGEEERFEEVFPFIYDSNGYVANRAGWVVEKCAAKYPYLVKPHINEIIDFLPQISFGGLRRLMLKVLTLLPIPETRLGEVIDVCLTWLESPREKVAIKVYSMQILTDFCRREQKMIPELLSIIENHYERNSFAFQSRADKVFEEFKDYL